MTVHHPTRVSDHILETMILFGIPLPDGRKLPRDVRVYALLGERLALVDAGVKGSWDVVSAVVSHAGRDPKTLSTLFLTHAHPDHVGGALETVEATGCTVFCHADAKAWVEDTARQNRERPVPGFDALVGGPVTVAKTETDGESFDFGGATLRAVATPGHSKGHLAFVVPEDGALIAGDAVPVPGTLPVWDDPVEAARSIRKMAAMPGIDLLLSSWDRPRRGNEIAEAFDAGLSWIAKVHRAVHAALETAAPNSVIADAQGRASAAGGRMPGAADLCPAIFRALSIPPMPPAPPVVRTVEGHLRLPVSTNF